MNSQAEKHPADEIGKALSRAGGILTSLSNCYDKSDNDLEVSVPFIFEAVAAVEKLLARASDDLARLYQNYDLTKLPAQPSVVAETELEQVPSESEPAHLDEYQEVPLDPISILRARAAERDPLPEEPANTTSFFSPVTQATRLAAKLDNILDTMPKPKRGPSPEQLLDRPAQTYQELLEKITAMADAAAFQAHQSPANGQQSLVPVLETLRADVMRIRVAS